jgi:hypothetical protein
MSGEKCVMILISTYDYIQGIDLLIIISFSIAMIIGILITGILIVMKSHKIDIVSSKKFLIGAAMFALLMGLGRLVFLYHDYFADDSLDAVLWTIASGLSLASLTSITFAIEKYIFQKTKMAASIVASICIILVLIFGFMNQLPLAKIPMYIGTGVAIVIPFFIYIYIAKISTGSLRRQAVIIITGMLVMFIAQVGGMLLFTIHVFDVLASQLFGILIAFVGVVILSVGFAKTPKAS